MARLNDTRMATGIVAAAVLLSLCGASSATEQGITGAKLLLTSSKLVLLSRDASIDIVGANPVTGADSSLTIDDGSGPVSVALPASHWAANGAGTLFKYANAAAPAGPSAVRVAKVKSGKLKLVAKGPTIAVPNGPATVTIVLRLDGGAHTYCLGFSGVGNGTKLLVKDAATGACPSPTATVTATATATASDTPTATPTITPPASCQGGATLLSTAPSGTMVLCDDPSDATCEQDFETLCPPGWQLCSQLAFNARNDGWTYVAGSTPALGEIYCRLGSGAGHFTVFGSLGADSPMSCYYGSSRDGCEAVYGCNETDSQALCCLPDPACGDAVVGPNERCDDGNTDETDGCLNSCDWQFPAAHGLSGINCG